MNSQLHEVEKSQVKLEVEVPYEDMAPDIKIAVKALSNYANIPGFRKGKAPQAILENYVGIDAILEEASQGVVAKSYSEAILEHELEPVVQPKIEITQLKKNEPMKYIAHITLKPDVTLGQYKGIEVTKKVVIVDDAAVDQEVEKARARVAKLVDCPEGSAIKDQDMAIIDFKGYINDAPFEGGEAADYRLIVGSKTFIPGFEDQLYGLHIGDEKDVVTTFPEDYTEKSLAGKEAVFKVAIKGLKEKALPELNDEFVKEVSESCNTLAEYREEVKSNLQAVKNQAGEKECKNEAIMVVVENAEVDIPEPMVEARLDDLIADMEERLKSQGLSLEMFLQFTQSTMEKMREDYRENALQSVKSDLVMEAVAKAEDFPVSEEDISGNIEKMAEAYWQPAEEVRKAFEDSNSMGGLILSIKALKAEDYIYENAVITEELIFENLAEEAQEAPEAGEAKTEDPADPEVQEAAQEKEDNQE